MGCGRIARWIVQAVATILLLIAMGLTIAAIVTPAWQSVCITNTRSCHKHGLWLDCVKTAHQHIQNQNPGEWVCSYKFDRPAHEHGEAQHRFEGWHVAVLCLMTATVLIAFAALLFSFCAPCSKWIGVVWSALTLLAVITSVAGILIFYVRAQHIDNRYIHHQVDTYEQEVDSSFWMAVGGMVVLLFSFVFAIITTVILFFHDARQQEFTKPWPKHHTAV